MCKNRLGHTIVHHQNRAVTTLFDFSFTGTILGSKEAVVPRHNRNLRAIFKLLAAISLVSLGSTTPLDTSCTLRSETRKPRQHMVLDFPGRWI